MKTIRDSEDLAERLRALYRMYDCEHELPAQDDLVAKLSCVKPGVREATKIELDRDCVYPRTYDEVLHYVEKTSLMEKLRMCLVLASFGGVEYACSTPNEKQREPNDFLLKLYALYGGIKSIPSVVKEVFLTPKEEEAKELMEEHNKRAAQYFKGFKNNIAYYFLKP